MRRIFFLLLFAYTSAFSQEPADAIRYSMTDHGGTARSRAIGGAVSALGGDLSAAYVNPAGLGLYRTSEVVFTPSFHFNNNKANYLNTTSKIKKTSNDFNNFGIVLPKGGSYNGRWSNFTFAIGMVNPANFNNKVFLSGNNNQSSFSEKYLEELARNNVTDPNKAATNFPYGSSLAFNTYLIDTLLNPNYTIKGYRSLAPTASGLQQENTITTTGGIRDFFMSASANYSDKLYFGGTIVFSRLSYERNSIYRESDYTKKINNFNYFESEDYLYTSGVGTGIKLGVIARPIKEYRIGISYHSPVVYSMIDNYSAKLTTDLEGYMGNGVLKQSSLDLNGGSMGEFQYSFTRPSKLLLGMCYTFGADENVKNQKGFVSADIEYDNYKNAKFSPSVIANSNNGATYLDEVNTTIQSQYKSGLNIRLGGELKFNVLMARAGFNYMTNSFTASDLSNKRMNASTGVGYRNKGYFIDLTYVYQMWNDGYFPYRLEQAFFAPSYLKNNSSNIIISLGIKF
ncbi:MAG: OmpP1/FadL family transporter [Chitinophagaceae bacterium]